MEEDKVSVKKIISTVDGDKFYSNDVDETTSFYDFKIILSGAAHLLKNSFHIFFENEEFTNECNDNTIKELFPNANPVLLRIAVRQEIFEYEEELISIKFINAPCEAHSDKYKLIYCFTCKKSIWSNCFNQEHKEHIVKEKADILAPSHLLMNKIFSNSSLYKSDPKLSKYEESISFRTNLKFNIFKN